MRRGTTPTHTFNLPFDMSAVSNVRIIYAQGSNVVLTKEKSDCECDGNTISFKLTQEETFLFDCGRNADVQVRVLTAAGDSLASDIHKISIATCLDNGVLE